MISADLHSELQKTASDIEGKSKYLIELFKDIHQIKNCSTCGHFNHVDYVCAKYQMEPPIHVAIDGCPDWVMMIPF